MGTYGHATTYDDAMPVDNKIHITMTSTTSNAIDMAATEPELLHVAPYDDADGSSCSPSTSRAQAYKAVALRASDATDISTGVCDIAYALLAVCVFTH